MTALFTDTAAHALGWALLHFLWQGAAIAAAYALVRLGVRERNARLRYAAGSLALVAMLAAFVATFALFYADAPPVAGAWPVEVASAPLAADAAEGDAAAWSAPNRELLDAWLPSLVAAWLAGVVALSLRFAGAWVGARRFASRHCAPVAREWRDAFERIAHRVGVSRPVRLVESAAAEVPSVVGWLRPVVVVPAGLFTGMDPRQIEALLAHELAHVRRHDYLANLAQSLVETLLFYHPAVWWVSRTVREERERCCDDAAVAACGDVLTYARALAELETLRGSLRALPPAPALAATGGSLVNRIRRLVAPAAPRAASPAVSALVAVATVAALLASAHATDARVQTLAPPAPPAAPTTPTTPTAAPTATPMAPTAPAGPFAMLSFVDDPPAPPAPPEPEDAPLAPLAPITPLAPLAPPAPPAPLAWQSSGKGFDRHALSALDASDYASLGTEEREWLAEMGVTPEFIRDMSDVGFGDTTISMLVGLSNMGVTAEFVRSLRAEGVDIGSPNQAIALRVHGATPTLAREYAELGFRGLAANNLIAFRIHSVTPDFVRDVQALGFAPSANDLVAMRIHDVSSDFITEIRSLGYDPAIRDLIAMRVHDISASDVRDANAKAGKQLPIREIIRRRIMGGKSEI